MNERKTLRNYLPSEFSERRTPPCEFFLGLRKTYLDLNLSSMKVNSLVFVSV
jgi:hypothetical protein